VRFKVCRVEPFDAGYGVAVWVNLLPFAVWNVS
jgi:hypothetical protein